MSMPASENCYKISEKDGVITMTNTLTSDTIYFQSNFHPGDVKMCMSEKCIFTPINSRLRKIYNDKIKRKISVYEYPINILCYASYELGVEAEIITQYSNNIKEIHLTDHAYMSLSHVVINFSSAISEFIHIVNKNNSNIDVYIHLQPEKICHTQNLYLDLICGIDIDYTKTIDILDNMKIINGIAFNTLRDNKSYVWIGRQTYQYVVFTDRDITGFQNNYIYTFPDRFDTIKCECTNNISTYSLHDIRNVMTK
jgi:hypothetical protein